MSVLIKGPRLYLYNCCSGERKAFIKCKGHQREENELIIRKENVSKANKKDVLQDCEGGKGYADFWKKKNVA